MIAPRSRNPPRRSLATPPPPALAASPVRSYDGAAMPRKPIRFSISGTMGFATFHEVLEVAKTVEDLGFSAFYTSDHLHGVAGAPLEVPLMEPWTLVAGLAAATSRLRLGCMVSGVTYRHPSMLAKVCGTIDVISGGRLEMGIGARLVQGRPPGLWASPSQACGSGRNAWKRPWRFSTACGPRTVTATKAVTTRSGRRPSSPSQSNGPGRPSSSPPSATGPCGSPPGAPRHGLASALRPTPPNASSGWRRSAPRRGGTPVRSSTPNTPACCSRTTRPRWTAL